MSLREQALIAGRYRVERQIGAGGMGAVWLAIDQETAESVALKRAHGVQYERQLQREARIVRDIHHPRIVALHDVVTHAGESWLVMEYVPSRDLAAIIAADGVLPVADVARIGAQVADALHVLHSNGIVHGDVSPGNILITESGDAKLTDFGVSRAIWSDGTMTTGGLVPGTPAYLAPEVARGDRRTPASDIFSLGATLYAALEGSSPLGAGDNPLTLVWRAASGHISAPTAGPLGQSLSAMLQPEPARRPDAAAAAAALTTMDSRKPGAKRKRTVSIAAAAVVVVAVVSTILATTVFSSSPPKNAATIGDERTADPCALVDQLAVKQFGSTSISTDYGNFNRCDVLLSKGGNDLADVEVSLEAGPPPDRQKGDTTKRVGAITEVNSRGDGQQCDRLLLLRDGNYADVDAKLTSDQSMDVCKAATLEAEQVASVLNKGPVPRRKQPWPHGSLATVDACSLLDNNTLARIPGFPRNNADPDFAHWSCFWGNGSVSGQVWYDHDYVLTSHDGQKVVLHGRTTFIVPRYDGDDSCTARIVFRSYVNADGSHRDELVDVEATGPRPVNQLCNDVRTMASTVATRLPKA